MRIYRKFILFLSLSALAGTSFFSFFGGLYETASIGTALLTLAGTIVFSILTIAATALLTLPSFRSIVSNKYLSEEKRFAEFEKLLSIGVTIACFFLFPFAAICIELFLIYYFGYAFSFSDPSIPVWSNVSGRKYEGNIKAALALQIKSPVRWTDIVEDMIRSGVTCFIEIGPGSTLTGLIRRISRDVKTYNAGTVEGVNRILEEVRNV